MSKDNKPKPRVTRAYGMNFATKRTLLSAAPRPASKEEKHNVSVDAPPAPEQPWQPLIPMVGFERVTRSEPAKPKRFVHLNIGSGIRTLSLLALAAVAIFANLDRMQEVWTHFVPRGNDVSLDGPIPQMLFIRSNPSGARVFLNDRAVGRTPYAQGYSSAGARLDVRIEAPGHLPWHSTVDLADDGSALDVKLKRRPRKGLPALAMAQAHQSSGL